VAQQDVREHGHRVHQVLAGVQHQQHLLVREMVDQLVHRLLRGDLGQADGGGHRVGQELGVPQTAEFGDAHPVREVDRQLMGGPNRDPGLADATEPGERDHARLCHRLADGLQLGHAPDEPGRLVPRAGPGPCPLSH
jgi:hypothetical protein